MEKKSTNSVHATVDASLNIFLRFVSDDSNFQLLFNHVAHPLFFPSFRVLFFYMSNLYAVY